MPTAVQFVACEDMITEVDQVTPHRHPRLATSKTFVS
jgi:hypothetical protein